MTIGKLLGLLLLPLLACGAAVAQVSCLECKTTALAEASQCRAQAAPDTDLLATCDKKFAQLGQACQEVACIGEAGGQGASQCSDCAKQVEAEMKRCAPLPAEVRAACEARAAGAKKACEDKFCPAARAK